MDAGPSTFITAAVGSQAPTLDTVLDIICALDPCPLSLEDKKALRATCRATRAIVNATLRTARVTWGPDFDGFCGWELAPQMARLLIKSLDNNDPADTPSRACRLGTLLFTSLRALKLELRDPECLKVLCWTPLFKTTHPCAL